jgi:cobalt-zinc-cadmium efflux system membrane fusion protein
MIRPNSNIVAIVLALAGIACRGSGPADAARAGAQERETRAPRGHGERGAAPHAGEHPEARHPATDEKPISDLDRPLDELFAAACEHEKKTFECDECRYQVGVVRVAQAVRDGGLVKTAVAARRKLESPVTFTGEIGFDERHVTHLSPGTEARVRAVRVMLGQRVRAGEALVELESVGLGEAESQYLEARGALELARRAAERAERLREEKIASEKEWLQSRQEHEAAEIRTRAAAERLGRLGLARAEIDALAARGAAGGRGVLLLRAPAAGVVLEMHAVPGELVRPEQAILTVGDLSDLWVWADVYEDQLGRVLAQDRAGLRAGVTVKAFPGEIFPGTVDFVGPTMDEKSRTVKMRIGVRNATGKLRAGMFATVQLFLQGNEEGLAVPRSAFLEDEGRSFVFVHHHSDYFVRRPVEAGRTSPDWVEVTRGLAGGETVAADGAFLLKSDVLRAKMGAGCAD